MSENIKKTIALELPKDMSDLVKDIASKQDRSVSSFVRVCIQKELDRINAESTARKD